MKCTLCGKTPKRIAAIGMFYGTDGRNHPTVLCKSCAKGVSGDAVALATLSRKIEEKAGYKPDSQYTVLPNGKSAAETVVFKGDS